MKKILSGILIVFLLVTAVFTFAACGKKTYNINDEIETDLLKITVTKAKIMKGDFGNLPDAAFRHDRMIVAVRLVNIASNDLTVVISNMFYLKSDSRNTHISKNAGGDSERIDSLSMHGFYYDYFVLSSGFEIHGYIAFDIPQDASDVYFIYKAANPADGGKTSEYKVSIPFVSPLVHSGGTNAVNYFEQKALAAGYVLEIEHDYDGYGTFWMGAHKYGRDGKISASYPEPLFTIDLTVDKSYNYSEEEYDDYAGFVKEIGGSESADEWTNNGYKYKYQVNSSESKFGVVYRGGTLNFFVVADAQYKAEIVEFLSYLPIDFTGVNKIKE